MMAAGHRVVPLAARHGMVGGRWMDVNAFLEGVLCQTGVLIVGRIRMIGGSLPPR
jgi:hypothetical protein